VVGIGTKLDTRFQRPGQDKFDKIWYLLILIPKLFFNGLIIYCLTIARVIARNALFFIYPGA
jgi:hypothetical protein